MKKILKPISAAEEVAELLRNEIMNGKLAPGTALRQDDLASRYGWSRIPVREALGSLRAEGLVDYAVNRGAVVSSISPDDVLEMLELRIALEAHALRLSVPRIIPEEIEAALELLRIYDETEDIDIWSTTNARFHEALCSPCDCRRLIAMIHENYVQFNRFSRMSISSVTGKEGPQKEHYELLQLCRSGDADGAVTLLENHIRTTQKIVRGKIRTGCFEI